MNPTWTSDCGRVQLYLGDCLEILPTLGKVDAVVTDPPYGIGFAAQPTTGGRKRGQPKLDWDNEIVDLTAVLSASDLLAVWGGNYYQLPASRGWLSWFKPDAPPSMASTEFAWTNQDMNSRQISCSIAQTNPERLGHPTQKPLKVMVWTLDQIKAARNGVVLDPFAGLATTGVACVRTGRRFIGIEIEPRYFEIARERIQRELAQPFLIQPEQPKMMQEEMV